MTSETKNTLTGSVQVCQSCKQPFTIEPEDFDFYKKMSVPPPTWCSECRMRRRMTWRNERVWYRRKCDATGKSILSTIPADAPYKVYDNEYWRSDAWDPLAYGKEYDFGKSFFSQFDELLRAVPHPNLLQKNVVNSEYATGLNLKNSYFVTAADTVEDSGYVFSSAIRVRECFDVQNVVDVERSYHSIDVEKSEGLRFSQSCIGCSNSYLLYDCKNCTDCFGCVSLRSKQFCIFNKQYSRDEYRAEIQRLAPHTFSGLKSATEKFELLKHSLPRKYASITQSERVTGDDIVNARNCLQCFDVKNDVENCRYSFRLFNTKDTYDANAAWNGDELVYESLSVSSAQRVLCSALIWSGFDVAYSHNCSDCNNIFGCVGLRSKSYYIFNRPYSKDEYEKLRTRIIEQMNALPYRDAHGRVYGYGEFFPPDISLCTYNETPAQDYYPRQRAEAIAEGFRWRDEGERDYKITKHIADLPDDIRDVPDSITGEVIECVHQGQCTEHCAGAFRIIPSELQFLRKMSVPLPRLCPACRYASRVKLKNPLRLWHRTCMCASSQFANGVYKNTAAHSHGSSPCLNEFETPYAPDRKEIIYCEQCYNAEIV